MLDPHRPHCTSVSTIAAPLQPFAALAFVKMVVFALLVADVELHVGRQ
jgi:hypothetical protein